MAASARAPRPADARIPCPLCGGLIHPIAGRCKHCKGDLGALRAARPPAAAALPPLVPTSAPAPATTPALAASGHGPAHGQDPSPNHGHAAPANGHAAPANGHAVPTIGAIVSATAPSVPLELRHEDSQPILPPRPTGRMTAAPSGSAWRHWPVAVIALAILAIVVAVILMVWPPGDADPGTKGAGPTPAPERMDTRPDLGGPPPPGGGGGGGGGLGGGDPWSGGVVPGVPDLDPPVPPPPPQPPADPDPDVDLQDPFGNGVDPFANLGRPSNTTFMFTMVEHLCRRIDTCGIGTAATRALCGSGWLRGGAPPSCPAARRCLRHIDAMSCSMSIDDQGALLTAIMQATDCIEAMTCP